MDLSSKQVTTNDDDKDIDQQLLELEPPNLSCPRCHSTNTKFAYYNNLVRSQPRYLCKSCKRFWTKGGMLRYVAAVSRVRRKNCYKKRKKSKGNNCESESSTTNTVQQQQQQQQFPLSVGELCLSTSSNNGQNFDFVNLRLNDAFTDRASKKKLAKTTSENKNNSCESSTVNMVEKQEQHPPEVGDSFQSPIINNGECFDFFDCSPLSFPLTGFTSLDSNPFSSLYYDVIQSSTPYSYLKEAEIAEDLHIATTTTISPSCEIPITSDLNDSADNWSWDDLKELVTCDIKQEWDCFQNEDPGF
ncbi:hypothetical protein GIB67_025009 [Kingdonia uniflora]|uniref:Dof zinc finger protein n=1 Tax=Kingdonia uniflora TaxID=39325 RepID=A0A7J7N7M2_9MAGN|nr:hypothetical protein GIB67_025009 [Kingdonia uniflora]